MTATINNKTKQPNRTANNKQKHQTNTNNSCVDHPEVFCFRMKKLKSTGNMSMFKRKATKTTTPKSLTLTHIQDTNKTANQTHQKKSPHHPNKKKVKHPHLLLPSIFSIPRASANIPLAVSRHSCCLSDGQASMTDQTSAAVVFEYPGAAQVAQHLTYNE